jgi:hypothetical protein
VLVVVDDAVVALVVEEVVDASVDEAETVGDPPFDETETVFPRPPLPPVLPAVKLTSPPPPHPAGTAAAARAAAVTTSGMEVRARRMGAHDARVRAPRHRSRATAPRHSTIPSLGTPD